MSRSLAHLNLWLLGALLVIGLPLLTVALRILVIRVLSHPFSGDLAVNPGPFLHVVRDFGA